MNKIYLFLFILLTTSFSAVQAQEVADNLTTSLSVEYPENPLFYDDFNYVPDINGSVTGTRNKVTSILFATNNSQLFGSESIVNSVYKKLKILYFRSGNNLGTSSSITTKILPINGSGIDAEESKYNWKFRFKLKGVNDNPSVARIHFISADSQNGDEIINILIDRGAEFKDYDIDLKLGSKNFSNIKISAIENGNDFELKEISIFTDSPIKIPTTFNGNEWTYGKPDFTKDAIFDGNFNWTSTYGDIKAKSLTVKSGSDITVSSGSKILLEENLIVEDAELEFQQGSYLIQYSDTQNIGNVSFIRSSKPMFRYDTNTWSSPVTGQTLYSFSPNTLSHRFYNYLSGSDTWSNAGINSETQFIPGFGYGIFAPNNFPNYNNGSNQAVVFTGKYTGVPNNGNYSVEFRKEEGKRYYLVGNPYPSPISLLAFLDENWEYIDNLSMYTHQDPVDNYINDYLYQKTQYLTINNAGTSNPNIGLHSLMCDVGQAFFIQATESYPLSKVSISFKNYPLRFENENDNDYDHDETPIFFRGQIQSNRRVDDKFWLSLMKDENAIGHSLIAFSQNSTDGFDEKYDAKGIDSNLSDGIYSLLSTENYIIQTLGDFTDSKEVALGYKVTHVGEHSIDLAKVSGVFQNQKIYLKDKLLNKVIDLSVEGKYNFVTESGYNDSRFSVIFKETLRGNEITGNDKGIYTQNNSIIINLRNDNDSTYFLYDITGKLIASEKFKKDSSINNLEKGIYIVNIKNGVEQFSKKVKIK